MEELIMNPYQMKKEDVLKMLGTDENGLTQNQAKENQKKYGKNELAEGKKKNPFILLLEQYKDFLVIILIIAAIISGVLGDIESAIVIFVVITINAILGTVQHIKAEQSLDSLKEMSAPTAKVIRDGEIKVVEGKDVTVGDIVVIEAGDYVCSDGRIIENASLKVDESAMTGESEPVEKQETVLDGEKPLGDRVNMLYSGSFATYGRAKMVVTSVGMETEIGKIASLLKSTQEKKTPLQESLDNFGKKLSLIIIGICVIVLGLELFRSDGINLTVFTDAFVFAVALAVAAIPEGLATVVTIVLSIGVTNMSKRNAIIRKLTAVETLGCTQIICTDKTGTLTQNKMTVVDHYGSDENLLANAMSLCSDAEFDKDKGDAVGEPTECALVNYAATLGLDKNNQKEIYPRIGEIPFDSMRKMMTTVHKDENGNILQFTKGAPDEIVKRCSFYLKDGKAVKMDEGKRNEILAANKEMADRALRVLAVAQKRLDSEKSEYTTENDEKDMCFVGLVGMIDPVRPEVKPAIDECKKAGIRPVMITGDHKDTAVAIAMQLGIISDPSQAITGADLDKISDEDFANDVEKYSVYARVQPEHKTRIVNAWRAKGYITAMTGDGVNDAPSIKNADIGVGMGITGTDVTKNVADMILTDDNFATIVSAVGEGRRIYDNIRKSIQFLLASNLSEVLSIFIATLAGFTIFKPAHLLWINLITDCFPALSLGMESAESDVMSRPPRNSKDGVFANGMGFAIGYQGILITLITIASYFIGAEALAKMHHAEAIANGAYSAEMLGSSMAFLTLSMAEIFHAFNMRSLHGSVFKIKKRNWWLWGAGILSLLLTTLVVEIRPLADAFDLAKLDGTEYAIAIALAFSIIPMVELVKAIARAVRKKKGIVLSA